MGPKLFSMYCGGLSDVIKEKVVCYADDAYVILTGDNMQELTARTNSTLTKHVDWLESIGMVLNVTKTEAVVFNKSENMSLCLEANGIKFTTQQSMRVLGVTFDSQLKWNLHATKVIAVAKRTLHGLRILRRNMSLKSYLQIITSQFYSKIYYGLPI